MKKFIVLGALLLILLSGCSTETTLTTDEKVANLVNNYLEALETKDKSSMVKYTDDLRFPDKEEQKKQYSSIDEDITDTKIVELKKVSETEFEVTVELANSGDLSTFTFPIQKQKKGWKIIVGQDTYN
ncbi:hypothetical protein [Cytobacillus massiliigabonensis]|uniref:hypothetical protein n=1 Tax=Cytobacillus massiliigabonensis TaxID=1871011 RepID=UPI000C85FE40|nr:hypothetical protein [Cytobacillus massiliigabonensis]